VFSHKANAIVGDTESRRAARRAALLLVAAGVGITLIGLRPIAAGLIAAPTLASVCGPVQRRMAKQLNPHLAAIVVVCIVWIVLVVPSVWLASASARQVPNALNELRRAADVLRAMPTPLATMNADSLAARVGARSAGWLATALGPALGNIAHAVLDLSVGLLGLYFLLVTGDAAWNAVRSRLPFSPDGSEELRRVFVNGSRGSLLGTLLSATLQGISIGIGLWLIGNDAPVFWGAVGAFTTLVPLVGNALVWVPALIAPLLRRDFVAALVMFAFGKIVPALLDHVTRVAISRHVGKMHPLVTLIGAVVGLRLVGPIGLLVGPTLVQCTLAVVQLYEREHGLPWTPDRKP